MDINELVAEIANSRKYASVSREIIERALEQRALL